MLVEDKPVMSNEKLFSHIGGILSLWLGLNFMFVVEVAELVICLVRHRFTKNSSTQPEAKTSHNSNQDRQVTRVVQVSPAF